MHDLVVLEGGGGGASHSTAEFVRKDADNGKYRRHVVIATYGMWLCGLFLCCSLLLSSGFFLLQVEARRNQLTTVSKTIYGGNHELYSLLKITVESRLENILVCFCSSHDHNVIIIRTCGVFLQQDMIVCTLSEGKQNTAYEVLYNNMIVLAEESVLPSGFVFILLPFFVL